MKNLSRRQIDKEYISKIIENAVEIATNNILLLQDKFEGSMGRSNIIANYIVPWSIEAENLWENTCHHDDIDYYDFIDGFANKKINELYVNKSLE